MGSDWQVVINFHGIGSAHDAVVESERPYWISADQFEAIIDRAQAHPNAKRVRWTFDDGNRSDLVIGARVLAERGMRGAFFVLTGRFDDPLYLSRADTRALADMGMAVGLHGKDHVDWRRLDPATLADETVTARQDLSEAAGQAIDSVAIPFGGYDRRVIAHLRRCNFARIYTSDGGMSHAAQRICNRTSVRNDMSMDRIDALLAGQDRPARRLKRLVSTTVRRHLR